jgi:Zn-dependent protease with chaperone function
VLHLVLIFAYAAPFLTAGLLPPEAPPSARGAPWWVWLAPWCVAFLACMFVHIASRRGDQVASKSGSLRGIDAAQGLMRLAWLSTLMCVFAICLLTRAELPALASASIDALPRPLQHAASAVLWLALSLLPVLACIVGTLLAFARCERRLCEALLTRTLDEGSPFVPPLSNWAYASSRLRRHATISLVPIACIVLLGSLLAAVPDGAFAPLANLVTRLTTSPPPALQSTPPHAQAALSSSAVREAAESLLAALGLLALAPHAIARVWGVTKLGPGPLQSQILRVLAAHRVRAQGPSVLASKEGEANALVLGAFWPSRYLLFTGPLLERLPASQLDAVVAHEVAHIKLHHMPWLLVAAVAAMLTGAWAGLGLGQAAVALGLALQWNTLTILGATQAATLATLLGLALGLVALGFVSRRFEWQADAFAVRHLSREELASAQMHASSLITARAAHTVRDMLQSVAQANGFSTSRPDFRHGSIEHRQTRALALIGLPSKTLPIDRTVLAIKAASAAALIATVVPILLAP